MASIDIAIAGGGIAGLTAALALGRRGIRVTVYEQAERLEEIGAGLQVSSNAWRVLDRLALADELRAASVAPEAIGIYSGRDGARIARVPLGKAAEARWGAPYRVVHRADLQDMLARAAGALPNVTIRLGARVGGLLHDGAHVEIATGDGYTARHDGLVGADGLRSAVRLALTGDGEPHHSRKVAWRATLPASALPTGILPAETGLWLGRDAHLVHYAVRDGSEFNIVAVVTDDWDEPGWSAPGDPAEIAARLSRWPDRARALVAAPRVWHRWALADLPPMARWGRGPVTLMGDAAHPMLPFMAQGAAMGIEDAHVLAAQLAGAGSVAAAFRRYEGQRMSRTARVQRAARANGEIYHLGGLAARARDIGMSVLGPARLMARFDWIYGWKG